MKKEMGIRTTGEMRQMLVDIAQGVLAGTIDIDKAVTVHKLVKNVTESLYSETKIAMFHRESDQPLAPYGELRIGTAQD